MSPPPSHRLPSHFLYVGGLDGLLGGSLATPH